jgi:hypothetical protein
MRVGFAHASVSGTISLSDNNPTEFKSGQLLASRQLTADARDFATSLSVRQRRVINTVLQSDTELLRIAARVGWSLESQKSLYEWVKSREDWQLQGFGNVVIAGRIIDPTKLGYLIGPLAKMMTEFEGDKLGGFTAYIADGWLEGKPLSLIREAQQRKMEFGRLIHVIYARIQYLLPWALFGLNDLIQYESGKRGISVNAGVGDLSVLASEGVPNFDALRLVTEFDIERVDATRLASAYRKAKREVDIVGWLRALKWQQTVSIVLGTDRRRLDPDLNRVWELLQKDS